MKKKYETGRQEFSELQVALDEAEGICTGIYRRGVLLTAVYDGMILHRRGNMFVEEKLRCTNMIYQ